MAFDGSTISGLVNEFNNTLKGGRIYKIAQPEPDELFITVKNYSDTYKLYASANSSFPLIYLSDEVKPSPKVAPRFCMLLRKYIQNGRIISITQPSLERVIDFEIEHTDELGDLKSKHLICEFMGKHSNIILIDENNKILDSLKRIPLHISSVREVLPGKDYFIPDQALKADPLTINKDNFYDIVFSFQGVIGKALYCTLTGLSPLLAAEICERSGTDNDRPANSFSPSEKELIYNSFCGLMSKIKEKDYYNAVYYDDERYEYSVIELSSRNVISTFDSPSKMIVDFYIAKERRLRIKQKSADLRKLVNNYLDRTYKKIYLQESDILKTRDMDKYKVYGELLQAFGYSLMPGAKEAVLNNYYDNDSPVTIPLKPELNPIENANEYFSKYNKLKRTFESATVMLEKSKSEAQALESVSNALDISTDEEDLAQIKEELKLLGYIKSNPKDKKSKIESKPLHYISCDGDDIFVGKNNFQNEELTFKVASANDWWFHAKGIAGSHVILKSNGKEPSDKAFEEAGALAAFYSKGKKQEKVEVDYLLKKEIRKPPASNPGFVIYHTNYSLIASTDISQIRQADE